MKDELEQTDEEIGRMMYYFLNNTKIDIHPQIHIFSFRKKYKILKNNNIEIIFKILFSLCSPQNTLGQAPLLIINPS